MKIRLFVMAALAASMRCSYPAATQLDSEAVWIGPGDTPPKVTYKIDPTYTPEARGDQIQGTILLEIIIDKNGVPRDIDVLSPLGFGLDEQAIKCVSEWRFKPGLREIADKFGGRNDGWGCFAQNDKIAGPNASESG